MKIDEREPKPAGRCPLCGRRPLLIESTDGMFKAFCPTNKTHLSKAKWAQTESGAVKAWNDLRAVWTTFTAGMDKITNAVALTLYTKFLSDDDLNDGLSDGFYKIFGIPAFDDGAELSKWLEQEYRIPLILSFIGRDSWDRPVYEDADGRKWKDTDPRLGRPPRLCTALNNDFDGEPNTPMYAMKRYDQYEVIFKPQRDTWGLEQHRTEGSSHEAD